jgi:hypothetical protein
MSKNIKLQCRDCNDNLTDCTCIEDTVDMKQETLEEAKSNYADIHNEVYDIPCANLHINNRELIENAIEFGAKWQQEQDRNKYSEVFEWLANKDYLSDKVELIQKEFEQFKKK